MGSHGARLSRKDCFFRTSPRQGCFFLLSLALTEGVRARGCRFGPDILLVYIYISSPTAQRPRPRGSSTTSTAFDLLISLTFSVRYSIVFKYFYVFVFRACRRDAAVFFHVDFPYKASFQIGY